MITAKNLKRAGFKPTGWVPLEDGGEYRTWSIEVQYRLWIEVDEENIPGKPIAFLPSVFSGSGEYIYLNIDNVTRLLQLRELLS